MKFAQANLNCVGTVDFVTKIKRFPCLPLRTRKPSAEFSLRGLRGARSLAPGPVAAPRGRPSAAGHGGHLLGLPVLPEAAGREGSMFGLTEQQALRGKAVRTQVPALSAASKGARSRSRSLGGPWPGLEEPRTPLCFQPPASSPRGQGPRLLRHLSSTLRATAAGSSLELRLTLGRRPFPSPSSCSRELHLPESSGSQGKKPPAPWEW